uniref:Phage DNA packaging protein Nu1 subunit of terminase-like protein n=1 Tax=Cereibacter sphaeroides (strain ATCC 17025 / ATH 2.4.3) TaxID=349102 RepID=A4WNS7_CERS5
MRILEELALDGKPVLRIGASDLCELLSLTPGALSDLKKRGIAVHRGHDAYDLAATVTAYVVHLRGIAAGRGGEEHTASLTAERARLAKEQADAQALKNGALRGELVAASEVERAWSDTLRKVRSRILAVPSRLRQVVTLAPAEVDALDRELRDALMELGNADR